MPTWNALTISHDVVREIDALKLVNQDAVNAVDSAAKGLVADELVGHLGRFIARVGSPVALLDQIANSSDLGGGLQRALAYAALHVRCSEGQNKSDDLWGKHAADFCAKMRRSARALASVAPHALGYTQTSGRPLGGALASVYT